MFDWNFEPCLQDKKCQHNVLVCPQVELQYQSEHITKRDDRVKRMRAIEELKKTLETKLEQYYPVYVSSPWNNKKKCVHQRDRIVY